MMSTPTPGAAIRTYLEKNTPFFREEVERQMLSELGLPSDVRKMKLGHVQYMNAVMALRISLPLPQNTLEILSERGYHWRNERSLQSLQPQEALYLDSIARLNELHDMYLEDAAKREHDAALKAIQGRLA